MPELEPIVAINVLLLLHVPPPSPSLSVVVEPTHTKVFPIIDVGNGLMVTVTVADGQPSLGVYVIIVVPAETPVTTP